MDDKNKDYLSAEELRNRLYHSLRNRGLVDSIKSQLRNSLVTELKQSVQGPLALKELKVPEEGSLLHRASNSLVANHLRVCEYEYSLSVFLPECGLSQDKSFDTTDLLKLLNISPHSRLHQRLSSQPQPDKRKGFLWQLLSEISALHANSSNTVSCQTDLLKVGPITPLDEKLSDVDKFYSSQREEFLRSGKAGAERRLLDFQHQLEDRYNTQLKMELARMRDAEISTFKMEEKEASRKALEQGRRELERVYRDKHDALVQRERNAMDRLQQQTDIQERETYAQRQSILEEIEAVRQRECEVKREAEVNKREKKLSEDRVKDKEDNLRRRELEINQKETSFEQRLQNEMAQFKLDQQARFIERIQNVEVRESTIKEQERIVSEEKARLQQIKDDLRDKTHRVNELETFLSEAKHKEINATKNNEYLNAKLRDMSDYSTLKEQTILYRNELETVRTRLAEVLSMNERERGRQEELLRELRRPSPECLMLQRDLERAKEELRQERVVFTQQKQLLDARLKEELDRNKDLLQRFEEQTLQMKDMNREVVDLRQHLHMTNKALNNEVYRNPKDANTGAALSHSRQSEEHNASVRHSVAFKLPADDSPKSRRFDMDAKDIYHDIDFDVPIASRGPAGDFLDDDASSMDSGDIIAQTKYRLKNLDKEAHTLERAYSDFHHRMTNIHAVPIDPAGPHTPATNKQSNVRSAEPNIITDYSRHSPITYEHPMSSTPYKKQRRPSPELNDSFAELGTHSNRQSASIPLDLSAVGDDIQAPTQDAGERRVAMRSITMDDLEQRPGSPGIVVMAESESSHNHSHGKQTLLKDVVSDPRESRESQAVGVKVTSETSADSPFIQPSLTVQPQVNVAGGFSLDSAWKSQLEQETEREREAERRQRQMEENLRQQEENERRRQEEERRKEEERQAEQERERMRVKEQEDEKIDPMMKQYMAMVQQQKEKEKELAKKTVETWSRGASMEKTPSQSENEELSANVDDKSEQDGDDGFSW